MIESTYWIDVCPSNSNLLATVGTDCNVEIFGRRESTIVRTIDSIHYGNNCKIIFFLIIKTISSQGHIFCVRWSPNGEQLTTASYDGTVKLLDFDTGKVVLKDYLKDDSENIFLKRLDVNPMFCSKNIRFCKISLLSLSSIKVKRCGCQKERRE